MFLFTTTPQTAASAAAGATPRPIADAIREGARENGLSFDYLLATAQRESALDPNARARTSSASGLFQIVEQTWLGLVKSEGARHGLGAEAREIVQRGDGTFDVADPARREAILALREDPAVAARLAGALTAQNANALEAALGRSPTEADLAVAHVLGATGAATLIRAATTAPETRADALFPRAAAANHGLFYEPSGAARSAADLYRTIAEQHGRARDAAPAFAEEAPLAFAHSDGPAFHGLFRTDIRPGPVSGAVASLWNEVVAPAPFEGVETPTEAAVARVRAERREAAGPLDLSAFTRVAR